MRVTNASRCSAGVTEIAGMEERATGAGQARVLRALAADYWAICREANLEADVVSATG